MTQNEALALLEQASIKPWRLVFDKERWLVAVSLFTITFFCWFYLWQMSTSMQSIYLTTNLPQEMFMIHDWTITEFFYMLLMWVVMMAGMMLPSAAPMILTYASIGKNQKQYRHTLSFSFGYLITWSLFSLIATTLQWTLDQTALLSSTIVSQSPALGATILISAGLYQLSPLKNRCLAKCRSPFQFIMTQLRPKAKGALIMGFKHGIFCLGCCGFLMGLLFIGGVMNLIWIALISFFVLFEKILPHGDKSTKFSGGFLIAAGSSYLLFFSVSGI